MGAFRCSKQVSGCSTDVHSTQSPTNYQSGGWEAAHNTQPPTPQPRLRARQPHTPPLRGGWPALTHALNAVERCASGGRKRPEPPATTFVAGHSLHQRHWGRSDPATYPRGPCNVHAVRLMPMASRRCAWHVSGRHLRPLHWPPRGTRPPRAHEGHTHLVQVGGLGHGDGPGTLRAPRGQATKLRGGVEVVEVRAPSLLPAACGTAIGTAGTARLLDHVPRGTHEVVRDLVVPIRNCIEQPMEHREGTRKGRTTRKRPRNGNRSVHAADCADISSKKWTHCVGGK